MPRPGFYNDNEYRAYPFVFTPAQATSAVPYSAIVDAGVIMGLDSEFDAKTHTVWLHAVRRVSGTTGDAFEFELRTDAPGASAPLVFRRPVGADEWLVEHVEAPPYVKDGNSCATEPAWSGFVVTGPMDDLRAALPGVGTLACSATVFVLEPARVQSLTRGYLRAITVGNLSRAESRSSCTPDADPPRRVIVNKRCLSGDIRFKEGYNAIIRQRPAANELSFTAGRNSGEQADAALCANGSEVPLYPDEPKPVLFGATETTPEVRSKFFSGGPACDELVATINGVSGPNVIFVGGTGVNITTDPLTHSVIVELATNAIAGNCG
jgi:hypothetical protein